MGRFNEIAGLTEAESIGCFDQLAGLTEGTRPAFPKDKAKYQAAVKEGVDNGVRLNLVDRVRINVEQTVGDPRFKGKPGWRLCRKATEAHTPKLTAYVDAVAGTLSGLVGEDVDDANESDLAEGKGGAMLALQTLGKLRTGLQQHARSALGSVYWATGEAERYRKAMKAALAEIGKAYTVLAKAGEGEARAEDDDTGEAALTEADNAHRFDQLAGLTESCGKPHGKDDESAEDEPGSEDGDDESDDDEVDEGCATPGMKIRSRGKGKGLAKGDGGGPLGEPDDDDDDGEEQDEPTDPMDEWERTVEGFGDNPPPWVKDKKFLRKSPSATKLAYGAADLAGVGGFLDAAKAQLKTAAQNAKDSNPHLTVKNVAYVLNDLGRVFSPAGVDNDEIHELVGKATTKAHALAKKLPTKG